MSAFREMDRWMSAEVKDRDEVWVYNGVKKTPGFLRFVVFMN